MSDHALTSEAAPSITSSPQKAQYGIMAAAGLVIVAFGIAGIAGIIGPAFLVITLIITVYPLHSWLTRHRVGPMLASFATLVVVAVILLTIVGALVFALSQMIRILPEYADEFAVLVDQAKALVAQWGIDPNSLDNLWSTFDLSSIADIAQNLLERLTAGASFIALIAGLVFFLSLDSGGFDRRMAILHTERPNIADGLTTFSVNCRRYWIVTTVFGLIVATLDTLVVSWVGIPLAFTWGVLAFVTNYIPNVGFIIGVIPPALVALVDQGPAAALTIVLGYSAINFIVQVIIQPRVTGDVVGVAPSVTFTSLLFWSILLGPLGALLSIPATLLVKALFVDHSPAGHWVRAFLTSRPDESTAVEPDAPDADEEVPAAPAGAGASAATSEQRTD